MLFNTYLDRNQCVHVYTDTLHQVCYVTFYQLSYHACHHIYVSIKVEILGSLRGGMTMDEEFPVSFKILNYYFMAIYQSFTRIPRISHHKLCEINHEM